MKYFLYGTWVNDETISEIPVGAIPLSDTEWDNRNSIPYQKTLDEIKLEKIAVIEDAYNAAIQQPVSYMGTTFQADENSQLLVVKSLSAGAVPVGFFWLDANNVPVTMTYVELQGLAGTMLTQGQVAFTKKTTLKAQIRAATTPADVALIVW